jgi:lipopolysaccharide transport system ATP-binding protein
MSSSDFALSVRGLSKAYTIRHNKTDHVTLAEMALHRVRHPLLRADREQVWALRDLDFDVHQGEVLGVVGRNGAGKSTLLKVLSRITEPTTGEVRLWGRVGSLLEVGTGFHPELTGRENVYLNGSILGMTRKEIDKQFDAIVEFANVEQFLDTPVKRYSSGMYVRLAFAVAAHLETEVLLVDEVLAVGDADFQRKCLGKLGELASSGRTILLVSHNSAVMRAAATRSIWLNAGTLGGIGPTDEILSMFADTASSTSGRMELSDARRTDPNWGARARICAVVVPEERALLAAGGSIEFALEVEGHDPTVRSVALSMSIQSGDGYKLGSTFVHPAIELDPGERTTADVAVGDLHLAPGVYTLSLAIGAGDASGDSSFYDIVMEALSFEVTNSVLPDGTIEPWASQWGPIRFSPGVARVVESDDRGSSPVGTNVHLEIGG